MASKLNPTKVYLGDAVYAELLHGQIHLTTQGWSGVSDVTHTIILEREVYEALVAYAERLKKEDRI